MTLTISDDAKLFISKNGNIVYFDDYPSIGTCVGEIKFPPSIKLGIPKDPTKFEVSEVNEIKIYLPKDIQYNRDLTIKLKKSLGRHQLVIDGWKFV